MGKNKDTGNNINKLHDNPPEDNMSDDQVSEHETSEDATPSLKKTNVLTNFTHWYSRKKKLTIPLTILLILGVALAIPLTRYFALGWAWKEDVTIHIVDSQTNSPVSEASVSLDGQQLQTDTQGNAVFHSIHVGYQKAAVTKTYYKDVSEVLEVPLFAHGKQMNLSLEATGRLSSIILTNKISGQAISNALINAGNGNQARTDQSGAASIVIPADQKSIKVAITANDYNNLASTVSVDGTNTLQLVPSGVVYFLSNKSGNIDVVKANLDGSNRKTVLAGTGNESDYDTTLLVARDWQYLALKSKRSVSGSASMYIIDTKTDKTVLFDQGNASFTPIGWSGHYFLYSVDRNTLPYWAAKRHAIKSYNADTGHIQVLDENAGVGSNEYNASYEYIGNYYIVESGLVYTKTWNTAWSYGPSLSGKKQTIVSISADGSNKKVLQTYDAAKVSSIGAALYKPQEVYYSLYNPKGDSPTYIAFEDGQLKSVSISPSTFDKHYPTFIVSPDGKHVFWREVRDGKNTIFTGDKNAENERKLIDASEFTPYGWLSDSYILLQKNNSELYITTTDQLANGKAPLKISDYHKPDYSYGGYGYGGQ